MNTNKPSVEFDLWLSRKILVPDAELTNVIDWHPTANIMHAIALLEKFMAQHEDRYTHVEFVLSYGVWIINLCSDMHDEHFLQGRPLATVICNILKSAIESIEEDKE